MNNLFRSAYDGLHGAKIHKNTQREKENPKKITHTSPYFSIRNAPQLQREHEGRDLLKIGEPNGFSFCCLVRE